jgi:hypothetical protein
MLEQPQSTAPPSQPFEEHHYSVRYWAHRWGFSEKTVREWFRDEYGPGILRQSNVGRRKTRNYVTTTVAPSAAARLYAKRTGKELIH